MTNGALNTKESKLNTACSPVITQDDDDEADEEEVA